MRIIILTSSTNRSGGTRQAMYQARELAARGHDVSFCISEESELWGLGSEPYWVSLPADRKQWKAPLEALFATSGPTILHAYHNKAVKYAAWHGLFWRSRGVVCCAHRGVMYRPGNPLPYLSPGMAAFIANSEACARVLSWYAPASKRFVVYNGVEDARITPVTPAADMRAKLDLPERGQQGRLVFGCIAQNSPVKGVDVLIDAFARADTGQGMLLLVGVTGPTWMKRCRALGIADRVRILGHTESVSDVLQLMDVFVLPSRTESLPNTMLEAIRMGLPVIGSNVGGVPELVRGNGLLVPPGNADALAQALTRAAGDPQARKEWAEASQRESSRYTIAARVDALESVYQTLLKRRGLATS